MSLTEVYPHSPEGCSPLDFGDPPDPNSSSPVSRSQLITDLLRTAEVDGSSWPPQAKYHENGRVIEEEIEFSESLGVSLDVRNARLVGCVAATLEVEQAIVPGINPWGIMRHLGMLGALGATMVAGLRLSPDAIDTAARVHLSETVGEPYISFEATYASPGIVPVIDSVRRLATLYPAEAFRDANNNGKGAFMKGAYTDYLDQYIRGVPPGQRIYAAHAEAGNFQPTTESYNYVLGQIHATRKAFVDAAGDVDRILTVGIGRYNLVRRN